MMLARKLVNGCGLLGLLLAGLMLAGCETLQSGANANSASGSASVAATNPNLIAAGDKLLIEFSDVTPGLAPVTATVQSDGMVTLPHNLTVKADGKTWSELATEIHQKYVPGLYRRLTVSVRGEDRFYTVLGQVKNPGPKNYFGQITVLKGIAAAGDFTDFAKKTNVRVTRANGKMFKVNAKKAIKDPSLDIPVYPGDTVYIDRRFW